MLRVGPDPFLRFDTNDCSLDPALVGRRVEVRVDQRSVAAVVLDTGETACQHARTFAKHRTITTELEHLVRQLKAPAAARTLPKLADRAALSSGRLSSSPQRY